MRAWAAFRQGAETGLPILAEDAAGAFDVVISRFRSCRLLRRACFVAWGEDATQAQ
ncbi:hypothetical protein ACRAWD_02300 [Caulobacter segnis]